MKALIQRVSSAGVRVEGEMIGAINQGLLVLLAVEREDDLLIADKLLDKILAYRVFPDQEDKMNLSLQQVGGGLLLVSQFTLAADTRKGLRPSFSSAGSPELAEQLYNYVVDQAKQKHSIVETGEFAADMKVELVNDGPVTFMLEA